MSQPAEYPVLHEPDGHGSDNQPSEQAHTARRRRYVTVATLVGLASLLLTFRFIGNGSDGDDELSITVSDLADALSAGSAVALAELSCQAPTQSQSEAFDSALAGSPASFTVAEPAQIQEEGTSATVMMRMVPEDEDLPPQALPYVLRNENDGWCVTIAWNQSTNRD